jgi:hypothetical protein
MLMLIDTREQPPPESPSDRPAWEPNWRLWAWVVLSIGTLVAADAVTGFAAYVLACVGLACVCRAICVVTPSLDGLREYRQ